jgi:hypothetical protein
MAAMESQKSAVGVLRERVADRRGRNIGSVATARRELELVFYLLRDGHVRALETPAGGGGMNTAFGLPLVGTSRECHDPHLTWRGRYLD